MGELLKYTFVAPYTYEYLSQHSYERTIRAINKNKKVLYYTNYFKLM